MLPTILTHEVTAVTHPVEVKMKYVCDPRTTAVVILIDAHTAIIDRCAGGTLTRIRSILAPRAHAASDHMGDAPRQSYHPGTRGETAAEAAQRARTTARSQIVSEAARIVVAVAERAECIVIGGNRQCAAALHRSLMSANVRSLIVAHDLHRALDAPAIVARVTAAVHAHVAAQDLADVEKLLERTGAHTTGVVGPVASLDSAERGAVDVVFVSPKYREEHPDDVARLVSVAGAHRGRVETIAPEAAALLDAQAGGVGALLRFAPYRMRGDTR